MMLLQKIKNVGPGAMVAAAFIGPGTVTTATLAGASFGFTLLWAVLFSVIATIILQEMSARLGLVGRMGLGEAIRRKVSGGVAKFLLSILVISAILIGNAAYEAGNITGAVVGLQQYNFQAGKQSINPFIILIGVIAFVFLYWGKYKMIERFLVALVTLMSIIFLLSAILLQPDIWQILQGLFIIQIPENALLMVIGLIGTTVVPYNLFLHASSVKARWQSPEYLPEARWDTVLAVSLGGLITLAISITAASVFYGQSKALNNAGDLALQLEPLLGNWANVLLSLGFLAAGLSSAITAPLAAAYATQGILGWENTLKSNRFRLVWLVVLGTGLLFSLIGFKPLAVILFAQIANGLLLPVIACFLLWVMNDKEILGKYHNSLIGNIFGAIIILLTLGLGLKSVLSVFGFL